MSSSSRLSFCCRPIEDRKLRKKLAIQKKMRAWKMNPIPPKPKPKGEKPKGENMGMGMNMGMPYP